MWWIYFYYEWRVVGKKVWKFCFGGKWKCFFGLFDWKIFGKNGIVWKVVLLILVGMFCYVIGFLCCNCNILVFLIKLLLLFWKENGGRDYDVLVFVVFFMEYLLSYDCFFYKNGK